MDPRHPDPKQAPLHAFTLVELLVVIAVIALLVGLLLPALAGSRDAAKTAACLANQQQLLTATHAYAADRRGVLPTGPATPCALAPTVAWSDFFCNWLWVGSAYAPTPHATGHGVLMVEGYLNDVASVRCPGTDTPDIYQADLDNIASATADVFSAYGFRSYDQTTGCLLDDLGRNAAGLPARMLYVDVNRHGPVILPSPATNHRERVANAGYVDGHAATIDNTGRWFSALEADYAGFPPDPSGVLARFAQIIVNADFAEREPPSGAPLLP